MASISREDLLKLARMSQIVLSEDEISYFTQQLEARLTYITGLKDIVDRLNLPIEEPSIVNVLRKDVAMPCNPEPLLAQAPQREENYFVVPVVVKQK